MSKTIRPPKAIRSRVRLHHLCLSDIEFIKNGRKYINWLTLNKVTGVAAPPKPNMKPIVPTFLKIDVEGYEFPIMQSIVDSGKYLPLQIAMELHYIRHEGGNIQYFRRVSSIEIYAFMSYLRKFGGYYLLERRDHPICGSCVELVLAKLDCHNYALNKINHIDESGYQHLLDSQTYPILKDSIRDAVELQYFY